MSGANGGDFGTATIADAEPLSLNFARKRARDHRTEQGQRERLLRLDVQSVAAAEAARWYVGAT
ncbi:MAG TPA: hypothetical protein VD833_14535 [Vicinamibacterales bacterium]|nr:hypothetical protein [Vicinamibacterales bacterium]